MYFITVSELFGTNGEQIAREVAKLLNYTYYGEEELLKAAGRNGFSPGCAKIRRKKPCFP